MAAQGITRLPHPGAGFCEVFLKWGGGDRISLVLCSRYCQGARPEGESLPPLLGIPKPPHFVVVGSTRGPAAHALAALLRFVCGLVEFTQALFEKRAPPLGAFAEDQLPSSELRRISSLAANAGCRQDV